MPNYQAEGDAANAAPPEPVTQTGEPYQTRGQTRLATRHGQIFVSSNEDLPQITSEGVNMTADEAEAVLAEAATVGIDGLVFKVETKED